MRQPEAAPGVPKSEHQRNKNQENHQHQFRRFPPIFDSRWAMPTNPSAPPRLGGEFNSSCVKRRNVPLHNKSRLVIGRALWQTCVQLTRTERAFDESQFCGRAKGCVRVLALHAARARATRPGPLCRNEQLAWNALGGAPERTHVVGWFYNPHTRCVTRSAYPKETKVTVQCCGLVFCPVVGPGCGLVS